MDEAQAEQLSRVIAVINGKGGVGKTTCTANIGGQLALAGYRVLLVDLDVQGNLKLDLGVLEEADRDRGRSILDAIVSGGDFNVIREVRPGLDMIPGGPALAALPALTYQAEALQLDDGIEGTFARKLGELAGDYDMVLLDCPPGNDEVQRMALAATRYVLIPTRTEQASWEGLLRVGPKVAKVRDTTNPYIRYLGVVVFGHQSQATRVLRNTAARLSEVGETVPMLQATISHSEAGAHDVRNRGQLFHELAGDARQLQNERMAALRARKRTDNVIVLPDAVPETLARSADGVAADFRRLAAEICDRITAAETETDKAAK